jgi:hypothetical protein
MPDWNRIIVGDAFKVSSHDFNYYRDLFLIYAPVSHAGRIYGFKLAACAVFMLLLAKEKRILILAASFYVGFRLAIRLVLGLLFLRHDWRPNVPGLLVSAGVVLIVIRSSKGWRPSYTRSSSGKTYMLDLLVGVTSLGCTFALLRWINP